SERGLFHAERSHDERLQGLHRLRRTAAVHFGLAPLNEVEEALEGDLAWARGRGNLWLEAMCLNSLGAVRAARGDRAGGEELYERGMAILTDLGTRQQVIGMVLNFILLTDDPAVVEVELREGY